MHLDRGLTAAVGVVLAFSMLWTIAILIPDNKASTQPMGSTANANKAGGIVIHSQYPRIVKNTSRVVSFYVPGMLVGSNRGSNIFVHLLLPCRSRVFARHLISRLKHLSRLVYSQQSPISHQLHKRSQ